MIQSFQPVAHDSAEILVLGSMPGEASLRLQQYYGHPRNLFWNIIGALAGQAIPVDYPARLAQLASLRVALWDVLRECRREGSLDTNIDPSSERPNDIPGLLRRLPEVKRICFNGGKAFQAFKKHILSRFPELKNSYELVVLPSTSPANASIPFPQKLESWRRALAPVSVSG